MTSSVVNLHEVQLLSRPRHVLSHILYSKSRWDTICLHRGIPCHPHPLFRLYFQVRRHFVRLAINCYLLKGKVCIRYWREVLTVTAIIPNTSLHHHRRRRPTLWNRRCYFRSEPCIIKGIVRDACLIFISHLKNLHRNCMSRLKINRYILDFNVLFFDANWKPVNFYCFQLNYYSTESKEWWTNIKNESGRTCASTDFDIRDMYNSTRILKDGLFFTEGSDNTLFPSDLFNWHENLW